MFYFQITQNINKSICISNLVLYGDNGVNIKWDFARGSDGWRKSEKV